MSKITINKLSKKWNFMREQFKSIILKNIAGKENLRISGKVNRTCLGKKKLKLIKLERN